MLKGLIEIFEKLKATKLEKFTHTRVGRIDTIEKLEEIKRLLEEYKQNVLALLDLEVYLNTNPTHNKRAVYMNNMMMYLLYYRHEGTMPSKEKEELIRNDINVIEDLVELEDRVAKGVASNITYEPVLREIEQIDEIITSLNEVDSFDYLAPEIIKRVYDYLMNETHISYQDKYIKIGKLIARYNINTYKKRTGM